METIETVVVMPEREDRLAVAKDNTATRNTHRRKQNKRENAMTTIFTQHLLRKKVCCMTGISRAITALADITVTIGHQVSFSVDLNRDYAFTEPQ